MNEEALHRRIAELEAENAELRLRPKEASLIIASPPVELDPAETGNYAYREFAPGTTKSLSLRITTAEGQVWSIETKLAPDAVISRYDEEFAEHTNLR